MAGLRYKLLLLFGVVLCAGMMTQAAQTCEAQPCGEEGDEWAAAKLNFGTNFPVEGRVFDAENQIFLEPWKRHIVTGGDGVYEIKRAANGSLLTSELVAGGYFLGLAQVGSFVYALKQSKGCSESAVDNLIVAAHATGSGPLTFVNVFELQGFTLPNGFAYHPQSHRFFVADTAFLKNSGKIVAVELNPSNALQLSNQTTWLDHSVASHPNGLRIFNESLYFSDDDLLTHLYRVPINANGTPGTAKSVYWRESIFDDFQLVHFVGKSAPLLMLCDYARGEIVFLDHLTGEERGVTPFEDFTGPSSVMQVPAGSSSEFPEGAIVVTDKGVVCDSTGNGNRVSFFNVTIS